MMKTGQNARFDTAPQLSSRRDANLYSLVGRKLETIYALPDDMPDAVDALLRELDRKCGSRS